MYCRHCGCTARIRCSYRSDFNLQPNTDQMKKEGRNQDFSLQCLQNEHTTNGSRPLRSFFHPFLRSLIFGFFLSDPALVCQVAHLLPGSELFASTAQVVTATTFPPKLTAVTVSHSESHLLTWATWGSVKVPAAPKEIAVWIMYGSGQRLLQSGLSRATGTVNVHPLVFSKVCHVDGKKGSLYRYLYRLKDNVGHAIGDCQEAAVQGRQGNKRNVHTPCPC